MKQAKNNCAPWLTTLLVLLVPMAGLAQQRALPPAADVKVDFAKDIGPLLENRCLGCHSAQLQSNGLRLDSREALLTGGYTGPAIRPGDSAGSKLIHLVAGLEKGIVMPLDGDRLTAHQVGLLRAWIDQGAEWPAALFERVPRLPRPGRRRGRGQPIGRFSRSPGLARRT